MQGHQKEDLLPLYFAMSDLQRREQFADTAHTAEIIGVSQRTIQHWIECGWIKSITIGKKHQVYLDSVRTFITSKNVANS